MMVRGVHSIIAFYNVLCSNSFLNLNGWFLFQVEAGSELVILVDARLFYPGVLTIHMLARQGPRRADLRWTLHPTVF